MARDALTQLEVNEVLVHHARRGRPVVRLKGGDPFVFGRGGEEVEALLEAGIAHEIVPGVSNLTAAPALAGIPLTHRGTSAQVTILTGTSGDGEELDYERLASTPGTLVVFMGLRRLEHIADRLILHGRPVDEPAAVISRQSLPDQRVRRRHARHDRGHRGRPAVAVARRDRRGRLAGVAGPRRRGTADHLGDARSPCPRRGLGRYPPDVGRVSGGHGRVDVAPIAASAAGSGSSTTARCDRREAPVSDTKSDSGIA